MGGSGPRAGDATEFSAAYNAMLYWKYWHNFKVYKFNIGMGNETNDLKTDLYCSILMLHIILSVAQPLWSGPFLVFRQFCPDSKFALD